MQAVLDLISALEAALKDHESDVKDFDWPGDARAALEKAKPLRKTPVVSLTHVEEAIRRETTIVDPDDAASLILCVCDFVEGYDDNPSFESYRNCLIQEQVGDDELGEYDPDEEEEIP